MAFQKLAEVNRPRHVVEAVLSSIRDGSLKPGECLPSEAKLAELTGVGRTSVREALAALRLMGVVETRVGDGSYVRTAAFDGGRVPEDAAREIAKAISESQEALQLQEARAAFECGIVRLVAERWTTATAREFDRLLAKMDKAAKSEGYEDYIRLHRDFHLLLAQATENAIIERTERSFLEFMDHEGWRDMERQFLLPNRAENLKASVDEHREIIEALKAGEGAHAVDLAHEHYRRALEGDTHGQ